ncbi:MAG: ABC transporter permease [Erysipelotrichaceae bacterium]|nr:ABC transporter permease [Erysipelotrichaceae bacterium]
MLKNKKIKTIISILIVIGIYTLISQLNLYSSYLLPSPMMIVNSFIELLLDGTLINNILISLKRVLGGYVIALVLAMSLAIILLRYRQLNDYLNWILQFLRNVPPLSLIPLLILWFGIDEGSKLIIIILASFFPMFLNIDKGFKSVDTKLIEVGKSFNFNDYQLFKKIIFPSAVPDILIGMRIGLGYSYRAIIGAEMIASSSGLGYMINFYRSLSQTDVVMVGIITIGLLGYGCDYLFKHLANRLFKETKGHGWN